jgi:hypothetical protein
VLVTSLTTSLKGMTQRCIWYGESFIGLLATPVGAAPIISTSCWWWAFKFMTASINSTGWFTKLAKVTAANNCVFRAI